MFAVICREDTCALLLVSQYCGTLTALEGCRSAGSRLENQAAIGDFDIAIL